MTDIMTDVLADNKIDKADTIVMKNVLVSGEDRILAVGTGTLILT